jgi:primosomal protein N'
MIAASNNFGGGRKRVEWHSELTPRTRQRNWAAIAAGEAPVVVGAKPQAKGAELTNIP